MRTDAATPRNSPSRYHRTTRQPGDDRDASDHRRAGATVRTAQSSIIRDCRHARGCGRGNRQHWSPHRCPSQEGGHEAGPISRSLGVDLLTGGGLEAALDGVDAVVDTISSPPVGRDETVEYFGTTTHNLLNAEARVGVRHHVL